MFGPFSNRAFSPKTGYHQLFLECFRNWGFSRLKKWNLGAQKGGTTSCPFLKAPKKQCKNGGVFYLWPLSSFHQTFFIGFFCHPLFYNLAQTSTNNHHNKKLKREWVPSPFWKPCVEPKHQKAMKALNPSLKTWFAEILWNHDFNRAKWCARIDPTTYICVYLYLSFSVSAYWDRLSLSTTTNNTLQPLTSQAQNSQETFTLQAFGQQCPPSFTGALGKLENLSLVSQAGASTPHFRGESAENLTWIVGSFWNGYSHQEAAELALRGPFFAQFTPFWAEPPLANHPQGNEVGKNRVRWSARASWHGICLSAGASSPLCSRDHRSYSATSGFHWS